jgi:predicted RNA-binding Zn-ribbon protein involved in translation (DUF1610 family)
MQKRCLKCGYIRSSSDPAPDYECPKCGAVYAKVEAALQSAKGKEQAERRANSKPAIPEVPGTAKLVKCRTCGKDISRTARTCPHCGESKPVQAAPGVVGTIVAVLVLLWLLGRFWGSGTTTVHTACPTISDAALWLAPDKEFARREFVGKAQRLNASGQCVLEGGFGQGYQMFYITVSRSGNVQDAQILRFSLEELDN